MPGWAAVAPLPSSAGSQAGHMHVAHGAMGQRSDTGAQPPASDWEPEDAENAGKPVAQLQAFILLERGPKAGRQKVTGKDPKTRQAAVLPCKCAEPGLPAKEQDGGAAGAKGA